MKNNILVFWCVLLVATAYGQQQVIAGEVLSKGTKEPIIGATVFYDGSSLGTITDIDGKFRLVSKNPTTSNLIIRSLGFQTVTLPQLETDFIRVFMEPSAIELKEVTLEPDTWSRSKKMKVFKREFFGTGNHKCKLENPEALRLYYKKSEKTLYAFANRPLKITNKKLGYELVYDLADFEVSFVHDSSDTDAVRQVFYSGNTQFIELDADNTMRYLKKRKQAYFGSKLHFIRALYSNRLSEEGFELFKRGFPVPLEKVFGFRQVDDVLKVTNLHGTSRVSLLYKKKLQSFFFIQTDEFIIDPFGNFVPVYGVLFGGEIGKRRIATMLPIDFEVEY